MKSKIILLLAIVLGSLTSFAQSDKLYLHNGTVIDGTVIEVSNFTIVYNYAGEKTRQTISKYAVEKILHGGSNREEKITDKIKVNSEDDYESVVILNDKTEFTGLTKVDEVESSGGGKFVGAKKAQEKSVDRIKKAAAKMKCPFVYLSNTNNRNIGFVSTQVVKYGTAYRY